MGLLLGLLLLGHLTVVTYGLPILEAPESVTGPWKGDVNIPCTYSPLQGYTQVLVKWLVQRGSDPVTIFLRDSSGDHIQQAKYRGRLHVNHGVPGDVSLQLNTLEMDDRSHYMCEVTWHNPDGNQVVRDKIIELRVQKLSVSKPTVTTGSGYGFTVPQGMRISLQCQARGSPPISYVWYKEQINNQEPIKVAALSTLLFKPAVVANSGSYFCTAKGRVGSEQRSDIVKLVVKGEQPSLLGSVACRNISSTLTQAVCNCAIAFTSCLYKASRLARDSSKILKTKTEAPTTMQSPLEVNPSWSWTTEVDGYLGETSAGSGKGLPMFAIILIISLCCMVVFTMASIMLCRKTSQQGCMPGRPTTLVKP
ncbi:V-set and immunoglobulin domain-containing protein 4 isoform X3 [Equus przewalskii]|uniref:V-set and immunoglobulin domain-containing protein 4 isoform X3 n=1 Tax=Equus caballus TaxID=9796 RepID=UPI0038B3597E